MNALERMLYVLSAQMDRPHSYEMFHIVSIVTVFVCAVVFCLIFRNASAETEKILLMSVWGLLVVFEIYKQLVFAVNFEEVVYWKYRWDSFPFQFCSSPLYLLPLAALPRSESIRDVIRMFLATFSLFAGLAVLFYPDDVFSTYIGVSIQTMVHHGMMVIVGIWLGGRLLREGKMTIPCFLKASAVFAGLVIIALIMNLAAPLVTDMTFNMFFIGPNFPCQLVILDMIYVSVPYPLFLLIYMLGFTLAAFILFWLQQLLRPFWYKSFKEKRKNQ